MEAGGGRAPVSEPKAFLGVSYRHFPLGDGSDLYVTVFGMPFLRHLMPESWYEREWFAKRRTKLRGTSMVYRVRTKRVDGVAKNLVVKWCRVGEVVPVDTFTLQKFIEAEFNTPYEEFSLLMEMRGRAKGGSIRTHKPLAIFVPAKRYELWQTGRSRSKIEQKKARFRDVELDISRQYIMIYEWIKGVAVTEPEARAAAGGGGEAFRREMLRRAVSDMWESGFRVLDIKPEHIIVRPRAGGGFLRDRQGKPAYALVDFELLARTPEYEAEVKRRRRRSYLVRQRDRFTAAVSAMPAHLRRVRLLGVDYIHGDCESTNGRLWVVGHDPHLFDYFQPERWRRTPRESLSETAQVYHTRTKDGIELVWKVAHVGEQPEAAGLPAAAAAVGYNAPFEEFAYAIRLTAAGVQTIYPRAIYMLGHRSTFPPDSLDQRHYEALGGLRMWDGSPALRRDRNYILIWGYWNGTDELLATDDRDTTRRRGINADQALAEGRITVEVWGELMQKMAWKLAGAGFVNAYPKGTHFLLTILPNGALLLDTDGTPAIRICNFEFLHPGGC